MDSKLKEKVLREQDKLIYFSYNSWGECLFIENIDSELDFAYSSFNSKFLGENLEFIPELKSKNLLYLMKSTNEDVKKLAKEVMVKRVKEGGEHFFGGENVKSDVFGNVTNLWISAFCALDKEDSNFIKENIFSRIKEFKEEDPYAHSIIRKSGYITSMDNFLATYEAGVFTPEKLELLEKLASENPHILDSINYKIFQDSIFEMGEEFISRIAKYPNISNKVIIIAENNPELLETIKQGFVELNEDKRTPEILAIQNKVITYAAKNFAQLDDISFKDLANRALRVNDVSLERKRYEISEDYEQECDKEYERISQTRNSFKYRDAMPEKKKILLMKYFAMDTKTAEDFCTRYMKDIDSIEVVEQEAKEYLENVRRVLELKNETEVDELYYSMTENLTPLERVHLEDVLRESYAKSYVKVLSETDRKLSDSSEVERIDVDGKEIKKINLKGNFSLLVHSTDSGFKGKKEIVGGSFAKSWNAIPDTERHLASSCYITQDFLGHVPANENGVLAVFTKSKAEDINLMGPSDIDSNIKSYDFTSNRGLYITAENMPYNSRRVYSEIPVERKNPDYVLIFDDTSEEVIQNSYKAAAEFEIPVIFIDKKEVEKNQLENLDNLSREFQETGDLGVLSKLVSTYETNVAGWLLNREPKGNDESFTQGINNERFRNDFETREVAIYEMVENYLNEAIQNGNKTAVTQVLSIMETEIEKYNLFNIGNTPISKTSMKFNAQAIIDGIKQKAPEMLENSEEEQSKNVQITTIDITKLSEKISRSESIGKTEVDLSEKRLERSKEKEESLDGE